MKQAQFFAGGSYEISEKSSLNFQFHNVVELTVQNPGKLIVKTELLHGAKTDDEADSLIKAFSSFELITIDEYDWEFSGLLLQTIRSHGISVPITDALIAYLGIKYDIPVWTKDHHFRYIQAVYPELRLYEDI